MSDQRFGFDEDVKRRLVAHARATGTPVAELAQRLLDEGLRMAEHPGIGFRDDESGRHPSVLVGPDVVEIVDVMRKLETRGEDPVPATATWLRIPEDAVHAAVGYHEAFADESPEATHEVTPDETVERAASVADGPSSR